MGTNTEEVFTVLHFNLFAQEGLLVCLSAYRNKTPWRFVKNGLVLDAHLVIFGRFHDSSVNFMIFDHVFDVLGTIIDVHHHPLFIIYQITTERVIKSLCNNYP